MTPNQINHLRSKVSNSGDLGLHSVFACAEKVLDAQVLLDPFEKEFDLPAVFVQGCDGGGSQTQVADSDDPAIRHQAFFPLFFPRNTRLV